ncbi:MAG: hypothetical protein ACR2HN_10145 [Tepidiformaceae bacterium]
MNVVEALGLDAQSIVALAGGRGKAALAAALAEQAAQLRWPPLTCAIGSPASAPLDATPPEGWDLPGNTTDLVVVADLGILGRPLTAEAVGDARRAAMLARQPLGSPITAETVVRVLEVVARETSVRVSAVMVRPLAASQARVPSHIAARLVYGGYRAAVVTDGAFREVLALVR